MTSRPKCSMVFMHTKVCFVSRLTHQDVYSESWLQENSEKCWGCFFFFSLPLRSHSPVQLPNQLYQVKTISEQIVFEGYQRRFRL